MSPNRRTEPDGAPSPRNVTTVNEPPAKTRTATRKIALTTGVAVAVVAAAAGVLALRSGGDSSRTQPTASPEALVERLPSKAILDRSGLVAVLPNLKPAIDPALSRETRSGELFLGKDTQEAPASGQTYIWSAFTTAYGRRLSVTTTRYADPSIAHDHLVNDRQGTANQHRPTEAEGLDTGAAEKLAGLGDEAFMVSLNQRAAVEPEVDRPDRRYDIGGGYFDVRFRNVVVGIDLRGADYSPEAAKHTVLSGTELSLADSRRTLLPIIQAIKAHLY